MDRKVRQILDRNQWTLKAIYNTHSNADHIGGNKYLQAQTGCKIYAKDIEYAFIKYAVLEPAFLFGAYPPKDLWRDFVQMMLLFILPTAFQVWKRLINIKSALYMM